MKLLFICTHNRCRSILAEAIANQVSEGLIIARSAGSEPAGAVHPMTIKYLQKFGVATEGLSSQSWDEFEDFSPDVVITVCDSAAAEPCPLWMGNATTTHWGLADPSKLEDAKEQETAFYHTMFELRNRLEIVCDAIKDNRDIDSLVVLIRQLGE